MHNPNCSKNQPLDYSFIAFTNVATNNATCGHGACKMNVYELQMLQLILTTMFYGIIKHIFGNHLLLTQSFVIGKNYPNNWLPFYTFNLSKFTKSKKTHVSKL
jgi:hypothetical protein